MQTPASAAHRSRAARSSAMIAEGGRGVLVQHATEEIPMPTAADGARPPSGVAPAPVAPW